MKKVILSMIVFICAIALFSCKKDSTNANTAPQLLEDRITKGEWIITYFYSDSTDKSAEYSDYQLMFNTNRHLAFSNSLLTINGTWSTDGSGDAAVLTLNFDGGTGNEQSSKISGTWEVPAQSDDQVALKRTISGNVEYLNLQQRKR